MNGLTRTPVVARMAQTLLESAIFQEHEMAFAPISPVRADLVLERAGGEISIFDPRANHFHVLNPAMSKIWDVCDGQHTVQQIAQECGVPLELAEVACHDLAERGLLSGRTAPRSVSRREAMRSLAAAGVIGAVALPVISSITNSTAANTLTCIPQNDLCVPGVIECCPTLTCTSVGVDSFACLGTE